MAKKDKQKSVAKRDNASIGYLITPDAYETLCVAGYTSLDKCPEIMTAVQTIASLIGSITIHLMENTDNGYNQRIVNELSRTVDIYPDLHMTRAVWMQNIMTNLLLNGKGNSVVVPHTWEGYIQSLEPISADRISFLPIGRRDYEILIDGKKYKPDEVLHFVYNPDRFYPWKGRGVTVLLKDLANNLKQATATEKGFMESKWKPSIIVKVDALTDEFSSPEGRKKLLDEYVTNSEAGEPWLIPADQFEVEQIRPLTLADLAISDTVQLNKKTIASIFGVPSFLLGVGDFNASEWNWFIQTKVRIWCQIIAQEMTKKLLYSPKWFWQFNYLSLLNWDIQTIANVFGTLKDKGIVTGNEVRDRLGMPPKDGLDELSILENYIPADKIGDQKKLIQGGEAE